MCSSCCPVCDFCHGKRRFVTEFHISGGSRSWVTVPNVLKRLGQCLLSHSTIDVSGVPRENELIVISPCGERFRHILVGDDPIVHAVAHDVRIEEVAVADLHPDPYWLRWAVRDEMLVELPRAMRDLGIVRPLLIDECSRIRKDTMIELRMIPGHA